MAIRGGDGADLVQDALQRLALTDDLFELVGAADFFLQVDVLAREPLLQRGNLVERGGILERDRDLRGDLGDAVQLVLRERNRCQAAQARARRARGEVPTAGHCRFASHLTP